VRYFLLGGRRKSARRGSDQKEFIYVDQYHPSLLVAIMLLAILSISDGLFTFHPIERGATEENPFMAWFLTHGAWHFMIAYSEALRPHYPPRADGTVLLSFRRLFIIAKTNGRLIARL
jgi:hypothetical protein